MRSIVVNRLKEPSTWAGIAALAAVFGAPAGLTDAVQQAVVGLAGIVAIVARERGQS